MLSKEINFDFYKNIKKDQFEQSPNKFNALNYALKVLLYQNKSIEMHKSPMTNQ